MSIQNGERPDPAAWFGVRHVVEPGWSRVAQRGGSDAALLACAAHLTERGELDQLVTVLGDSAGADTARTLGLTVGDIIPTARSNRWPAPRGPRRDGALTQTLWHAAAPIAPGARAVLRAFDAPTESLARLARRAAHVEVFTRRDQDEWARAGVGARLAELPDIAPLAGALTAPVFDLDHDARLLAIIADRPGDLDARQFGFLLGLLAVAGHRVHGLMPSKARHAPLVHRHISGLHEPCRVFESRVSTLAALKGADLALLPPRVPEGSGAELVLKRWCAALNVEFVRFEQQPLGERRRTPALAVPVIEALARASAGA